MFEPPLMMRSFERSFSVRKPSPSSAPRSPVQSQPRAAPAGRFRVAPVAGHHGVAADDDLAGLAGRDVVAVASTTSTSTSACATPTDAMRSAQRGGVRRRGARARAR
jgi:hypothetical protein